MASIDKTYLNREQYHILKEWVKDKVCIYNNGIKSQVSNWLYKWNNEDFEYSVYNDGTLPCWNTDECQDRWLLMNCPLPFIQRRLSEQYTNLDYLFKDPTPRTSCATHFNVIKKPQFNLKIRGCWFINIVDENNYWWYNEEYDYWTCNGEFLPANSSCAWMKNFTIDKFKRKLKKWKIPAGLKIIISGRYVGQTYMIKTRL